MFTIELDIHFPGCANRLPLTRLRRLHIEKRVRFLRFTLIDHAICLEEHVHRRPLRIVVKFSLSLFNWHNDSGSILRWVVSRPTVRVYPGCLHGPHGLRMHLFSDRGALIPLHGAFAICCASSQRAHSLGSAIVRA